MTGTSKGIGRCFMDFDSRKSQEWLRRRKLRLEQVRKQSNEIARALREKVITGEKMRLEMYDRISQANFRDWKAEKMDELQEKLKDALEDFGGGYKEAEAEPDSAVVMEEIKKVNSATAQKRGEIALREVQKKKKQTEEKKMSPIRRKKLTRKKEDLRSALVRSVTSKRNIDAKDVQQEALIFEKNTNSNQLKEIYAPEKSPVSKAVKKVSKNTKASLHDVKKKSVKLKRKKGPARKSCLCKQKAESADYLPKNSDTIWINLNDIQSSSGELGVLGESQRTIVLGNRQKSGEVSERQRSVESFGTCSKSPRNKSEGMVEFYDHSSRLHCKTYREHPHSVERISSRSSEPNATELAELEGEQDEMEARRREENRVLIHERGMEALRREKISRDYSNLVSRLEELHKKEKVLKSQQQKNAPGVFHMSEERISERMKAKQRLMDSKFEDIYYEATSQFPPPDSTRLENSHRQGGGDWTVLQNEIPNHLTLSPSSFKPNTPVGTDEDTSRKSSSDERIPPKKNKKNKNKNQLLMDIEKTLKEGRELRKTASLNRERSSGKEMEEIEEESSSSDSDELPVRREKTQPATRTQECQTENLKGEGNVEEIDVSLPVSTSTCYRSPPSCSRSRRIHKFLDYLEGISETEDSDLVEDKQALRKKIDKIICDLLHGGDSKKAEKSAGKSDEKLTLEYYIGKLLNMSRECVANLSVSSENISTPNVTDVDLRDMETKYLQQFPSVEELVRQSRPNRGDQLQETIRNWRRALGEDVEEDVEEETEGDSEKDLNPEPEDVPDCAKVEESEPKPEEPPGDGLCVIYSPKFKSKYEEITKKCSARISQLSRMLDRVREEKEKLLSSASGRSSLSLSKDGRDLAKDIDAGMGENISPLLEGFVKKLNLSQTDDLLAMTADNDPKRKDPDDTLESWPDVMEELLKRKILSSPFKWSDGEYSSDLMTSNDDHLQPSSIETVIGNFRKEINKIKPFTVSDSVLESNSSQKLRHGSGEGHEGLFSSPRIKQSPRRHVRGQLRQEETSVDSINQALTSLGLNWAKSFLRKNEESKAISSSSNSERKTSGSEEDCYS